MYEIKQGPIHKESVIINPYMRGNFFMRMIAHQP